MSAPYIEHITLTTGHTRRSSRAEVTDAALAVVSRWLQRAIETGTAQPLPVPALSHYSAVALLAAGALVVTIYGPIGPHTHGQPHTGQTTPLITLGVAQRSRHGGDLWGTLVATFGATEGARRPTEPWCAVALHPAMGAFSGAPHWLGDLERCIAWAWITRAPQLSYRSS